MKTYADMWETLRDLPPGSKPILTIGNFDGLHKGHQSLIKRAQNIASIKKQIWGGLTFSPHPKAFFKKNRSGTLFSIAQKKSAFKHHGASFLIVQKFDEYFSKISPEDFLNSLVTPTSSVSGIIIGENFKFGKNRIGDIPMLEKFCLEHNIKLQVMPPITAGGHIISSSRIKNLLTKSGDTQGVKNLLGRPYAIEGEIGKGKQLGRQIGIPTLNLTKISQILPKKGVYSGWIALPGTPSKSLLLQAVINIGRNPTTEEGPESAPLKVEGHILGQNLKLDDHYGTRAIFFFQRHLRDEQLFANIEGLKFQIGEDLKRAHDELTAESVNPYWGF